MGLSLGNRLGAGKSGLSPASGLSLGNRLSFLGFGGGIPTPTLNLNFASGTMPSGIDFSRGSLATLVNSSGYVAYAPNNLLTYSQDFTNAVWVPTNTTVTANSTTAPNGTTTASKYEATANTTTAYLWDPVTISNSYYVFSLYAKAGNIDWVYIQISDLSASSGGAAFNVQNGTLGTVESYGIFSGISSAIEPAGNGWYRISVYFYSPIPSSSVFNIILASGNLDFNVSSGDYIYIWGSQVEAVTYQTTPSTYKATTSTPYNGPRIDYNPATLTCKGLLIEEQRTNFLPYSNFENDFYTIESTSTPNSSLSPNNTNTAVSIVPTTNFSAHLFYSVLNPSATVLSYSVYVKSNGYSQIALRESATSGDSAVFNLSTGTIDGVYNSGATTISNPQIIAAGNGWYRISMTCTLASAQSFGIVPLDGGWTSGDPFAYQYAGDGTSGFYLWGAQFEEGAFATSYIPTSSTAATRAQDIAAMTGTNFSSWYNQTAGTFVNTFDMFDVSSSTTIIAAGGLPYLSFTNNDLVSGIEFNYSSTRLSTGSILANVINKVSGAYADNDFASSLNGGSVVTSLSGSVSSTFNILYIGSSWGYLKPISGHIASIKYYNTRLPNAQVQSLTA